MTTYTGTELIQQMDALRVAPGCLAIWGLGQMGIALKGNGKQIIYIDPVLTDVVALKIPSVADKFRRAFPPPIQPSQITNATCVLCTHEHLDHTDPLTLGPLASASPQVRFIISGWSHSLLDEAGITRERRIVLEINQPMELDGFRVTAIPSAHYEVEHDDQLGYRWLGFLIEWNGVTFYHSGDTIIYPDLLDRLRSLPKADVALVAANGRDAYRETHDCLGNLMPSEAVWLAIELGWDLLICGHNDLYSWNTIPSGRLGDAVQRYNLRQKHHTLQPGELYYYIR